MNIKLMKDIWNQTMKPSEKLLLLALAIYADGDGVCWPSQSALSEKTGMAERTLRDAAKSLEKINLLSVEKHGRNRNRYQVLIRQNLPESDRQNLPELTGEKRQNLPDSAAKSAGLVRQNLPEHINNKPVEQLKEQYSCPPGGEPDAKKPAAAEKQAEAKKPRREKPELPPEIVVLGERLATCRTKDAGMKKTTQQAIDYYAALVNTILKRGEVDLADMESVVGWFETPEGMESFRYGMGNMPKDYSHALIRNLPQYLRRARGESMHFSGFVQPGSREPLFEGSEYDALGDGWGGKQ